MAFVGAWLHHSVMSDHARPPTNHSHIVDPTQEHYESPRRAANLAMITALDSVKLAFSLQTGPLALLRNAGLDLINATGPVRNGIMKYAMGL